MILEIVGLWQGIKMDVVLNINSAEHTLLLCQSELKIYIYIYTHTVSVTHLYKYIYIYMYVYENEKNGG